MAASALPSSPDDEAAAQAVGFSGSRAHVIRAVVLELEELGPYAVLVVGAEGEGAAADALLDQTVSGLEIGR